jgi:hypothetical protein
MLTVCALDWNSTMGQKNSTTAQDEPSPSTTKLKPSRPVQITQGSFPNWKKNAIINLEKQNLPANPGTGPTRHTHRPQHDASLLAPQPSLLPPFFIPGQTPSPPLLQRLSSSRIANSQSHSHRLLHRRSRVWPAMESLELIDVSGDDDLFLGPSSPPALAQPPDRDPSRAGESEQATRLSFRRRFGSWIWGVSGFDDLVARFAEADAVLDPTGGSTAAAGRASDPDGVAEDQEAPERTESPKQRKAKTGVNLRKSLAWDSAFFTSEGWPCFIPFPIP